MEKLIIEVRVNEFADRRFNKNVPFTPQEIAEDAVQCREAGAAIVHYHAREPDGAPSVDPHIYHETIRRVRARTDLLVQSTLGSIAADEAPAARVAHISGRAGDPSIRSDLAGVDLGTLNLDKFDPITKRFETLDVIYKNSTGTISYFIDHFQGIGVKPFLACWNVSGIRLLEALLDSGLLREPVHVGFVLTGYPLIAGHPGTVAGLEALRQFLPTKYDIGWTAMMIDGDILQLAEYIIKQGGHISIGLGDYAHAERESPRNADLVREVVRIANRVGRAIASPTEAAATLGLAGS